MLPFSSITSFLPLVILGIAYLAYFGTTVLSRHLPQNNPEVNKKIIEHVVIQSGDASYPDFRQTDVQDAEPLTQVTDEFHYCSLCILLNPDSSPKASGHYRVSGFMPRPPPFLTA